MVADVKKLVPVDIDERFEKHRYFQLAVVLDRQDCLRDITELRIKLDDYTASPERLKQTIDKIPGLRDDITFLALKYFRPASFESVMLAAVLYGRVKLKDYKPVRFKLYDIDKMFDYSPGTTMTIILDQFTTKKEIKEVFEKSFERYKKKLFTMVPDKLLGPIYMELKNPTNLANIVRDRKRYWRNVNGESYAKIALSELEGEMLQQQKELDNPLTDVPGVDGVIRAIQRYKRLLSMTM